MRKNNQFLDKYLVTYVSKHLFVVVREFVRYRFNISFSVLVFFDEAALDLDFLFGRGALLVVSWNMSFCRLFEGLFGMFDFFLAFGC